MIYCVEDDQSIRELMIYTLKLSGFEALGCENYKYLESALENEIPELILLDIMLPEKDGLSILKDLRSNPKTKNIPVIMETAKTTEFDKVNGLDLGADDYLAKPFGMMEMVARVKALLRRSTSAAPSGKNLVYKNVEMDEGKHIVKVNGNIISLTLKEYELLSYFMKQPGMVFTREQLLEDIWGLDYLGESRTIDVHVGTLRSKLGECGNFIHTVRGIGYCFQDSENEK